MSIINMQKIGNTFKLVDMRAILISIAYQEIKIGSGVVQQEQQEGSAQCTQSPLKDFPS